MENFASICWHHNIVISAPGHSYLFCQAHYLNFMTNLNCITKVPPYYCLMAQPPKYGRLLHKTISLANYHSFFLKTSVSSPIFQYVTVLQHKMEGGWWFWPINHEASLQSYTTKLHV